MFKSATISSVNNTHQAWSDGSGFSLEKESFCSPTRAPQEILESLKRIELSHNLDYPQFPAPQSEIDLVIKYEIIKKTSVDIKNSLSSVTNNQLIVKLGTIGITI